MSITDSAYTMWGVAQPGIPKEKPVQWLKDDCHRASVLSVEEIKHILNSLRSSLEVLSDYSHYWLGVYELILQKREATTLGEST
jgi:hypothetical protein